MSSLLGARFLQQRLVRDLEQHAPLRLGVAFSGGADSMALAHMAAAWADEAGGRSVVALHVNHNVRPESGDEQRRALGMLRRACPTPRLVIGEPLSVHWPNGVPPAPGHVQKLCRTERYTLLDRACRRYHVDTLLAAHHLNDQAETLLMRIARSTSLRGLAAMHTLTPLVDYGRPPHLLLWRPLLDVRKHDLVAYCRLHALDWIHDPSNDKLEYRRVYARHLVQALESDFACPLSAFADVARAASVLDLALEHAVDDFLRLVVPELDFDAPAASTAAALAPPADITQRRCSVDVRSFLALPAPVAARVLQRFVPTTTNAHAANFIRTTRNRYSAFLQGRKPTTSFPFTDLFSLYARLPTPRRRRS